MFEDSQSRGDKGGSNHFLEVVQKVAVWKNGGVKKKPKKKKTKRRKKTKKTPKTSETPFGAPETECEEVSEMRTSRARSRGIVEAAGGVQG